MRPQTTGPIYSPEAERAALAAAMISGSACTQLFELLGRDGPDAFADAGHRAVASALASLHRAGKSTDLVSVMERLDGLGQLELVGGPSGLADLAGASPTSLNIEHYAGIVHELSTRRRLQDLSRRAHELAADRGADLGVVLESLEQEIFGLAGGRDHARATHMRDSVPAAYARLESIGRGGVDPQSLTTGYPDLDRMTDGMRPGEVTIIAARPSVGKTAFALNVAAYVSANCLRGVLVYSLEMTAVQLASRLMCMAGGVDVERVKSGYLGREALSKAQYGAAIATESRIWVDESVSLTPTELRGRSRRHAARHKDLGLIVVDYLQLMHTTARAENRQNEIAEISRGLKCVARELNVHVLCLSQLSREVERLGGGVPQLSHLRDSGAIEQDADVVVFLSRPKDEAFGNPSGSLNVRVAKNRNGMTGDTRLVFQRTTQRIFPAASAHAELGRHEETDTTYEEFE